ncbi:MAG: type II toxin-antitoxin system PemK/MazF family toxin [Armatimonadota bacterium]
MSYSRGDVVLVLFPNSDLVTAKRRPALVVQADDLDTGIAQSSRSSRATCCGPGIPAATVLLGTPAATAAGLRTDSVIVTDDLVTVSNAFIARVIGRFDEMTQVDEALRRTLALS